MAAFVKALDLRKPLIVGYSDGGQTALEIGMNYPELPRALVAGGAMAEFTASYRAWVRDAVGDDHSPVDLERFQLNHPDWVGWLQEIYGPERWKALLARLKPMWVTPLNYTQTDLARIVAPTLLVIGDRDELVPVQEAARMYGLMRTAELAVVPGASHGAFFSRNVTAFQTLILDFLQRHG
jgi:pimeloyl-ACP methyl ester carboxylesterase